MSFSTEDTEIGYTTDGVETTYEIPFVYSHEDYIKIETYEEVTDPVTGEVSQVVTPLVKDTTFQFVDDETIQTIVLVLGVATPTPLASGLTLRIYRDTADTHDVVYSTYQFPYQTVNADIDQVYQRLQELRRDVDRAIKLNYLSLSDGEALTGEEIVQAIADLEELIEGLSTGAAGLPIGGNDGDYIEKRVDPVTSVEGGEWMSGSFEGFSARFNQFFSSTGLQDTLLQILNFAYTAPLISLSGSPSQALREKGSTVASVALTATTTKRSNDILRVRFYRAGVLVNTIDPATAGGTNEAYTSPTSFADNMSFYAQVDDSVSTVTSNTITYSYVYPYYYGVGAAGLNAAGIAALTKSIIASSASVSFTSSPTNQHFYFAYPSAYPALTSILDANGFETISGYTVRSVSITGLDGTSQTYRVYELTLPTTQVNFQNTYKR